MGISEAIDTGLIGKHGVDTTLTIMVIFSMTITKRHRERIRKAFSGIDRAELAKKLIPSKNRNLIDQIASGHKVVSPQRALKIEKFTSGRIPASVMRPDIFRRK